MEIAVLVVVLMVAAGGALVIWRRRDARRPPATTGAAVIDDGGTVDRQRGAIVLADDEVVLLPASGPGTPAVAIGSVLSLNALERAGLTVPHERSRPFQQLIDRWANGRETEERARLETIARQPIEGRWLRLTDESAQQMDRGVVVRARTGELLPMLNDAKSHRRGFLRFTGDQLEAGKDLALGVTNLQATLAMQAQLERMEERLIEIRETVETLAKDVDVERLAEVAAANETLGDVMRQVRRRGRMRSGDWDRSVEAEQRLRATTKQAGWSLADITRDIPRARSRRKRIEALEKALGNKRLEYWLTIFADVQLARTRWDLIHLLYEATEYPDEIGDMEAWVREAIAERELEMYRVGEILRMAADPAARSLLDHFQQVSHFRLRRRQPFVAELLERHGSAFPSTPPNHVVKAATPRAVEGKTAAVGAHRSPNSTRPRS